MRNSASPTNPTSAPLSVAPTSVLSLRRLAIAIFVLFALSLTSCDRIKRPYAGKDTASSDAPKYTATVNVNGVPQGN